MGVYIKGMNISKSCWSCDIPLSILKCPVQTEEEAMRYCSCRHKDCPLVPVPQHGRLIDADAFLCTIRPICDEDANAACTFETVKRLMVEHINNAPTIIPAEEGE